MIIRYWNTLRYLKFSQISGRVLGKFKRVKVDLSPASALRKESGSWADPVRRPQSMFGEQSFYFLNVSHDLTSADDWNNEHWEKLWLYNLHYFDDLNAADAKQRTEWHRGLFHHWINENHVGVGNGWEPYPSSLRIVNWIKWGIGGDRLKYEWLNSLTVQVRFLSQNIETHLLGNHIFANAKALLFAGLFFEGNEAEEWYRTGKKLVERELPEQLLEDGGNFELSTMYHQIFLEDLLDILNIHRTYSMDPPVGLEERIPPMVKWLDTMCHPDGDISFFNDAALGVTPSVIEMKSYLDRILGFTRLTGSCFDNNSPENTENHVYPVNDVLVDLPDSGYSRVEMGDAVAMIDRAAIGPDYLPGHGHADTFSFELSLFGQRVVVNSGTSFYGTGKQRQLERGTAAHSTVVIDGENSSEIWNGFRVARRARVFAREQSEGEGVVRLTACHDGYKRLFGKPEHCREWKIEYGLITINDKISGKGLHEVVSVLPLHPDVEVVNVENNMATLDVDGHEVVVTVDGRGELEVVIGYYHPEFGLSIENRKIMFRNSDKLPIELTTRIEW